MMYAWGGGALGLMWIVSSVITDDWNPLALARGNNKQVSTSQLQFLIFTALTVFAYVTVTSGRLFDPEAPTTLPDIPFNLLLLMGLSATTTATSKGLAVSYVAQGRISSEDNSRATLGRDGRPDLTKVQMIMWTLVTAVIYLWQVRRFISTEGYLEAEVALPDVDGALLVLMGVSQGGYVGGKLVAKSAGPVIETALPDALEAGEDLSILGLSFGDSQGTGDLVILTGPGEKQQAVQQVAEWGDTVIKFTVPQSAAAGAWSVRVRAGGVTSEPTQFEVS